MVVEVAVAIAIQIHNRVRAALCQRKTEKARAGWVPCAVTGARGAFLASG